MALATAASQGTGMKLQGAELPRYSITGLFLYALFLISVTSYVYVRLFMALPNHPWAAAVSMLLLLGELLLAVRTSIYGMFIIKTKRKYASTEALLAANTYDFHVRVMVPCLNEGLEIIQQTVMAAAKAVLPPGCKKSIYLCDDGRDPAKKAWMEFIAGILPSTPGCYVESIQYVSDRPRHPTEGNGKSNNMNNALQTVIYPGMRPEDIPEKEIIAVLDADMVALPHIYHTLLPYLTHPNIAIVQSPQNWYNYDPTSDVLDHSSKLKWHTAIPQTVNGWCGISCMGSNFVLRAKALAAVGWWPTWTVVEDQGLAQELKKAGYSGYFIEEVLAIGEAPTGVKDKYVQYSRIMKGYLTNWLSFTHGTFWNPHKTLFARIAANKSNRDLLCGFYAPLLLAIPPIALLANLPVFNFAESVSLQAWLLACLAFWGSNQAVLQFLSLNRSVAGPFRNARAACDVGANWLSNLFGSLLYWDTLLAAIPAVIRAQLTGASISFNCTPKSVTATALELARSLSRVMSDRLTGALRISSGMGRALSQMCAVDALRKAHFAKQHQDNREISTDAADSRRVPDGNSMLFKQQSGKVSSAAAVYEGAYSFTNASVTPHADSSSSKPKETVQQVASAAAQAPVIGNTAAAAAADSNDPNKTSNNHYLLPPRLPEVINPLTKPYKRAGPEPHFPWRVLKVHVVMLVLSLGGALKGMVGLALGTSNFASRPQELVLTLWCLHNAVPLLLLMYRTVVGDTVGLAKTCKLVPKIACAAAVVVGAVLLQQATAVGMHVHTNKDQGPNQLHS